jgi:leucyl aminopeptidase
LGDALSYACEKKPKLIIDLATLTGAVTVCLGKHAIGLLTNNDKFTRIVKESGEYEHERIWQLPLWKEYQEMIKSEVADIKNIGSENGEAGTITASAFLKEFVGETPWIHLDIAGVDQAKAHPYLGTRGSCIGTRLVVETLKRISKK